MKTIEIAHIDKDDMEYVNAFIVVGMNEKQAKILVHIYNVKEASQRDIERYTDMRQSDVSVHISPMVEIGYLKTELITKEKGKGRPMKVYMLCMSIEDIVIDIERKYLQHIDRIDDAFVKVKTLK